MTFVIHPRRAWRASPIHGELTVDNRCYAAQPTAIPTQTTAAVILSAYRTRVTQPDTTAHTLGGRVASASTSE